MLRTSCFVVLLAAFARLPAVAVVAPYDSYGTGLAALSTAASFREPHLAAYAFAAYIRGPIFDKPRREGAKWLEVAGRPGMLGRVAHWTALSSNRAEAATTLAEMRGGEVIAAAILAAHAWHRHHDALRLAAETGPGEPPTLGSPAATGFRIPDLEDPTAEEHALLAEIMEGRNKLAVDLAATAAAFYGADDPAIVAAWDQMRITDGAVPGARMLWQAKVGEPIDIEAFEAALSIGRRQARGITRVGPELGHFQIHVRSASLAAEAAVVLGDDSFAPLLAAAVDDDDLRVQIDVARAIGACGGEEGITAICNHLGGAEWPALVAFCDALGKQPSTVAIEPLIDTLKSTEGRFRQDVLYALSSIAGEQYGKATVEAWTDWWQEHEAGFAVDPEATATYRERRRVAEVTVESEGAHFYDLPIHSQRLCFVLDTSGSMSGDRIGNLRENGKQTLKELARTVAFNIIEYNSDFEIFSTRGLTNDRRKAYAYIDGLQAGGGTRTWDSLEYGVLLPDVDSVYLLTDGSPGIGQTSDWAEMIRTMDLINRYRPIAIHTVSFEAGEFNATRMEAMAHRCFGNAIDL